LIAGTGSGDWKVGRLAGMAGRGAAPDDRDVLEGPSRPRLPRPLVKVDTGGFELKVLVGASGLLDAQPDPASIVELTRLGERYGSDDSAVLKLLRDRGYSVQIYDAAAKRMVAFNPPTQGGNAIFTRPPDEVAARLGSAASATRAATP
jgi:hypothetical protein